MELDSGFYSIGRVMWTQKARRGPVCEWPLGAVQSCIDPEVCVPGLHSRCQHMLAVLFQYPEPGPEAWSIKHTHTCTHTHRPAGRRYHVHKQGLVPCARAISQLPLSHCLSVCLSVCLSHSLSISLSLSPPSLLLNLKHVMVSLRERDRLSICHKKRFSVCICPPPLLQINVSSKKRIILSLPHSPSPLALPV